MTKAKTTPGNEDDDDLTLDRIEGGDEAELEDEANEVESEKDVVYGASDTARPSYALGQKPLSRQNDGELAADGAFDVVVTEPEKRRSDDTVRKRRALALKAAKADFKYSAPPAEIKIEEARFADSW